MSFIQLFNLERNFVNCNLDLEVHSNGVSLILNIQPGCISLQSNEVFYGQFSTIAATFSDEFHPAFWNEIDIFYFIYYASLDQNSSAHLQHD